MSRAGEVVGRVRSGGGCVWRLKRKERIVADGSNDGGISGVAAGGVAAAKSGRRMNTAVSARDCSDKTVDRGWVASSSSLVAELMRVVVERLERTARGGRSRPVAALRAIQP
jgi:hypothetical protein